MFALAYAGGSWLGGFAVTGLVDGDHRLTDASANEAQAFWDKLSADRQARAEVPEEPVVPVAYVEPDHVCEGCDAGETRYRQFAEYLELYYGAPETVAAQDTRLVSSAMPRPRLPEPGMAQMPLPRFQRPVSQAPMPPPAPQR